MHDMHLVMHETNIRALEETRPDDERVRSAVHHCTGCHGAQRAQHCCRGHAVRKDDLRRHVAQDEAQLSACVRLIVS